VIEINTRYVHIFGTTTSPDGPWTAQQARNLIADLDERAAEFRFLIRDRAGQFTASFDTVFANASIEAVKIPPAAHKPTATPNDSSLTIRAELTDRMLIFGQRHLRRALAEYVFHYNRQRPHRGQGLRSPSPDQPASIHPSSESAVTPGLVLSEDG
jgi:hypothetical protein